MATSYLDKTGLTYLWGKIKNQIPTKTSDLTNDSNFVTSTQLSTKVDIAQGSANANKYLATDSNGNVITQELNCATAADIEEICEALGMDAVVVASNEYTVDNGG